MFYTFGNKTRVKVLPDCNEFCAKIKKNILSITLKEIIWFKKEFLKGSRLIQIYRFLNRIKNFVIHNTAKTSMRVERLLHSSHNLMIIHLRYLERVVSSWALISSSEMQRVAKRSAMIFSDCAGQNKSLFAVSVRFITLF